MKKKYSDKQMHEILDGYRNECNPIINILRYKLPIGLQNIATISQKFAFLNSIPRSKDNSGIMLGNQEELFYMCDEFFEFAEGTLPKEYKKDQIYQFSIDLILEKEEYPFAVVSFDHASRDYILGKSERIRSYGNGFIADTKKTSYVLIPSKEILQKFNFMSFEINDGKIISKFKEKKK